MEALRPPIANKLPVSLEKHGHTRVDDYYWMRERDAEPVLAYLKAENEYADAWMGSDLENKEVLFNEMKARIKEKDESLPYFLDGYFYYTRFEEGQEYPVYCRKKEALSNPEEILLDVNEIAKGYEFFEVSTVKVSPSNQLLLYGADTTGRRIYTLFVKDLTTGHKLGDKIENTTGNALWAEDGKTIFYTKQDEETLRAFQVYAHVLDTEPEFDRLVYQEDDETFHLSIFKTKSKKYLFIAINSTMTSEVLYIDSAKPEAAFTSVLGRSRGHEYGVDHFGDYFYITSNWEAKNFCLVRVPQGSSAQVGNWEMVLPHRADVLLESVEFFAKYMVVEERKDGLMHLRIKAWDATTDYYIPFSDPTYVAGLGTNPDFQSNTLRYSYNSLTVPGSVYDFNMDTQEQTLMKQQEVLGGYNPEEYQSERIFAKAEDGTLIPISIVYKKGFRKNGFSPLYLTGYGSYGISYDPYFSSVRLSLLNRGFAFAIAHIRGGQEMGREWYEMGRLMHKKNSFSDFIAVAEHLIQQDYTSSYKLVINGGSAGGLLMGAVTNMRPDLFRIVVADVPFVDVVTTMLDESIPLTTGEYDEWGNPNEKEYYDYILSYSPYDNVGNVNYPSMLVTTGYHDSQVQYWEPAKWVAKIRDLRRNDEVLLFQTNMSAGHGGASGRFERLKEIAYEYAFIFKVLEIEIG